MKKKIKDLTEEQVEKICGSHKRCYGCLLSTIKGDIVICEKLNRNGNEKEVEVDE